MYAPKLDARPEKKKFFSFTIKDIMKQNVNKVFRLKTAL